jgi:hypothetical protein
MKDEFILGGLLIVALGAFYYFAQKKPTLAIQLLDGAGNTSEKGSPSNPVTANDITAVSDLLQRLLILKAAQPTV